MPTKRPLMAKEPSPSLAMSMMTNRYEDRLLSLRFKRYRNYSDSVQRQYKSRQLAVLRRFSELQGEELQKKEMEALDKIIQVAYPAEVMQADYSVVSTNKHSQELPTIQAQHRNEPIHFEPEAPSTPTLVHIEDFNRPLYPWETADGMDWLKRVGSVIKSPHAIFLPNPRRTKTPKKAKRNAATATQSKSSLAANPTSHPVTVSNNYRENSKGQTTPPVTTLVTADQISAVLEKYEEQHRRLFVRNKFNRKKQAISIQYDPLYIEQNLAREASQANNKLALKDTTHPHPPTPRHSNSPTKNQSENQLKQLDDKLDSVRCKLHRKLPTIAEVFE